MAKRLIINLRGPNGAGKTTLARAILDYKKIDLPPISYIRNKPKVSQREFPVARCEVPGLELPVFVIGRYDVQQGGCDTEKDMDAIEYCVRWAADNLTEGHVFFEGFVVSKSGERWLTFSQRMPAIGARYAWFFLEPELRTLELRIKQRNGGKEIKLDRLENTVDCVHVIRRKARMLDPDMVRDLDSSGTPQEVFDQFLSDLQFLEKNA